MSTSTEGEDIDDGRKLISVEPIILDILSPSVDYFLIKERAPQRKLIGSLF
jgi:hypothetical protein